MNSDLSKKTLKGMTWSYVGLTINAVSYLVLTAVLARLLTPVAFGLIAMVNVVLQFGDYFAQMGIGQALIQKKEISNLEIRAAFTSSIILGFSTCVAILLLAPLIGAYYRSESFIPIMRAMAILYLISGTSITSASLLRRNFNFRSLAIISIVSYLLGYGAIGISFAYRGYGVWSLVIAALSQKSLTAILQYFVVRHSALPIFEWKIYKPILSFGSRVSTVGILEFFGANLDRLWIARFLGSAPLGLYNQAFALVSRPLNQLTVGLSRVLFPSFSRLQGDLPRLRDAYVFVMSVVTIVTFPISFGISAAAREFILVILGDQWYGAIPILRILAVGVGISIITHFSGIFCESQGKLNQKIAVLFVHIFVLALSLYFLKSFGLTGAAYSIVISGLVSAIGYEYIAVKTLMISHLDLYKVYLQGLLSGLITGLFVYLCGLLLRYFLVSDVVIFICEIFIGGLSFGVLAMYGPSRRTLAAVLNRLHVTNNLPFTSVFSRLTKFKET